MKGFKSSCRVKINAAGDWQIMPPAGQITQIGDAAVTSFGLVDPDDLFVTGKFEATGEASFFTTTYFRQASTFNSYAIMARTGWIRDQVGTNGAELIHTKRTEDITIAIGTGAAGINSATNLATANSIIVAVAVRVIQAPGGGAVNFNLGRTGGNINEFIKTLAVALNTTGTSAADGDGNNTGPVHNAALNTFVITTDANVTIADMIVRVCVWSRDIQVPTS